MAVYFLDSGPIGLIKIGHGVDPQKRLWGAQAGSPVPLTLAAIGDPGDVLTEAELHWRFRHLHSHCEWFRTEPELRSFMAQVKGLGLIPDAWYAPPHSKRGGDGFPRSLTGSQLVVKFNLTRDDIRALGLPIENGMWRDFAVSLVTLPGVVDYLQKQGIQCDYPDFFPSPDERGKKYNVLALVPKAEKLPEHSERLRNQRRAAFQERKAKGPTEITDATREAVRVMLGDGATYTTIAKSLGLNLATMLARRDVYGLPPAAKRPPSDYERVYKEGEG